MAKIIVEVIGMADRVKGQNKETGKAFDFRHVAFAFKNQYGNNAVSINMVPGEDLDRLDLQIGSTFRAVVNQVKNTYYIDLLDQVF